MATQRRPQTVVHREPHPGWLWLVLSVIAVATFATRYRWPLTEDAVMYALDLMRLERSGGAIWPKVFNGEFSFGYYWFIGQLYRLWRSPEQLIGILALVNVASSVVVIGLSMLLAQRWFGTSTALFAGLLLALAPAFWQLSRYGHPTMPALAAFSGALWALDRLVSGGRGRVWLVILFVGATMAAYTLRLDVVLSAPACFALVAWRGTNVRRQLLRVLAWWGLAVVGYVFVRLWALGYLVTPGGGSVLLHIGRTLRHGDTVGNVARNLALWAMGLNPLIGLAALGALVGGLRRRQYGLVFFLAVWLLPVAVLLPFYALDFSRIAVLSAAPAVLAAARLPAQMGFRRPMLGLAALLIAAQLTMAALYPVAVRVYAPKTVYQGRPLASVPLGFVWEDTAFRQRYLEERVRVAQRVVARQDRDVLIAGASNLMLYRLALATAQDAWDEERTAVVGIPIGVVQTRANRFYLFDADDCADCEQPLTVLMGALGPKTLAVHTVPFDTRFVAEGLWLDEPEPRDEKGTG